MAEIEDTIRETLRGLSEEKTDALKEAPETPTEPAAPSKDAETPESKPGESEAQTKAGRTANRLRDDKGRLLPGKKEEAEPQGQKGAAPVTSQSDADPARPAGAAELPKESAQDRLPRWRKGVVEKFGALDAEIKAEILKREDDFHKGIEQYREKASLGAQIEKVAAPYMHLIAAEGGTLDRAVGDLLRTAALFRTGSPQQKQQALVQIAQQFGIQMPGQVGQPQQQPQFEGLTQEQQQALSQNPWLAQMFSGWQQQFSTLQGRLHQFEQQSQLRERQMNEQNDRAVSSAIEKFEHEHDKDGWMDDWSIAPDGSKTPGPFRNLMSAALESGQAKTLDEAYEMARWAHPEARKVELARQQAKAEEERRKAQAVEEAKKAASVNVKTRGTLPATEPTGSMEDTIRTTYRRVAG